MFRSAPSGIAQPFDRTSSQNDRNLLLQLAAKRRCHVPADMLVMSQSSLRGTDYKMRRRELTMLRDAATTVGTDTTGWINDFAPEVDRT